MDFYPPLNIKEVFTKRNSTSISNSHLFKNKSCLNLYNYPNTTKKGLLTLPAKNPVKTSTENTSFKTLDLFTNKDQMSFIRKLGSLEKTFHGQSKNSRCYIYRTVIVSSEIDLYENIDTVRAGIRAWKNENPLLRCIVTQKPNESDPYFALKPSVHDRNEFENIKFLKYISNQQNFDEIWKLLVEHETTLSSEDDSLLWRLTFFNIKHLSGIFKNSNHYAIIMTYNHCIMDGRSSYNSILQLLAFIEDIHTNKREKTNFIKTEILPSKEEIYTNRPKLVTEQYLNDVYLKTPHFLDKQRAQQTSYIRQKYLTAEEEETGVIYNHDKTSYITVKQLVEVSKKINSRFRTLVINQKDLEVILAKCKANGTKLTSFLNMVIILALKLVYNRYGEDEETKKSPINFTVNVSLRESEEFKSHCEKSNDQLGCFVGLYFNKFTEPLGYQKDWKSQLWRHSKEESENFHRRIEKGQFSHPVTLLKIRKKDEFFYHFANSNIGVVKASLTERKLIRVKQSFTTARYSKENNFCWFTNLLATVNNTLCWTISFNSHYVSQDLITLIIRNISKIVKETIAN